MTALVGIAGAAEGSPKSRASALQVAFQEAQTDADAPPVSVPAELSCEPGSKLLEIDKDYMGVLWDSD